MVKTTQTHPYFNLMDDVKDMIKNRISDFAQKVDSIFEKSYPYHDDQTWKNYKNISETKGLTPVYLGYKIDPSNSSKLDVELEFFLNEKEFEIEEGEE